MDRNFFRVLLGSLVGSILEWYDFTVYVFLAPIISDLFFPHEGAYISILLVYAVFAVGYIARPIGAFFFGHYGDRIGRQRVFVTSMIILSIATILMGCLPTYYMVGEWAPILLVLLRIIQGLTSAGQMIGAVTLTFESSPPKHRGVITTIVWIGSSFGVLAASWLVAYLSGHVSIVEMNQWGWRLPFFFGIFSAIVGLYLKSGTRESLYFSAMVKRGEVLSHPALTIFRSYKTELFKIFLIFLPGAINFYIYFIFLPTYSVDFLGHALTNSLLINGFTMMFLFLLSPVMSFLSDRFGRKPFLIISLIANLLLSITLFNLVATGTLENLFIAQMIFAFIHSIYAGPALAISLESVPTSVRYSIVGITYSISYAIFGGTAPLIVTFLIHHFKSLIAPAFYIMAVTLVTLMVVLKIKETYKKVIV